MSAPGLKGDSRSATLRAAPIIGHVPAALRLIHPAPALAVTLLSAALAIILAGEAGTPIPWTAVALTVASVAGSQVVTGATNDLADRFRDETVRPEKPIPSGDLSVNAALWVASLGFALQLAASLRLGPLPLALGVLATMSALAYNVALSRTPASVIPYLISFGTLPFWIAAGIGVPAERVVTAALLVAPFAGAAHLANTLRDWESDAASGSRSLAQVLGRERSQRLAFGVAMGVGFGVGAALVVGGAISPAVIGLGITGLVAAVCWATAWALATG